MLSQINGAAARVVVAGRTSGTPAESDKAWLYGEGPRELPAEDDDFEGNRNWAVILVLLALALFPIAALALILL